MFPLEFGWLVKKQTPTQSKGLFCDKDGSVYHYGSNFPEDQNPYSSFWAGALADTEGSFIQKHSASGQHQFTKRWQNASFFITKIIYDGDRSLYFAGLFAGQATIDGILLRSAGRADAMVGKMDLNGSVQWVRTMGSAGDEFAEGLCFDANKTALAITGGYTGQLFFNGMQLESGQQSAFVMLVDINGNYIRHRAFDFLAQRDGEYDGNWGREIVFSKGNYYWLCDRQGRYWNTDTVSAPEHGRYLIKLNDNFDTLWDRYITGPRCYYGFTCKNLTVSGIGAVYLTRFCAGKYGGDGYLQRHDPVTGALIWAEYRKDGDWEDIAAGGNDLYTAGTVDANAAPGPGQYAGNQLVKNYDALNNGIDSLRMMGPNIWVTDIAPDGAGGSYIAGRVQGRAVINGQVIAAGNGETYAYFLARVSQRTMGIEPEVATQVSLYPNPAQETVTLEVTRDMIGARIAVFDVLGKRVLQRSCDKASTNVDVSACESGVYSVEVTLGDKKFVKKLVID